MGFLAWWRRRAARGEDGTRPARGSHDATVMISENRPTVMISEDRPTVMISEDRPTGPGTVVIPGLAADLLEEGGAWSEPVPSPSARPAKAARPAPSRSGVVGVLVAVEGELEGMAVALREGSNRIGRDAVCEVCLASESVAPRHASIDYRSGIFRVQPLGDAPVRQNFEPCTGAVLRDGDVLQIGRTTLRFRSIVGG